jgi:hypothetical protein
VLVPVQLLLLDRRQVLELPPPWVRPPVLVWELRPASVQLVLLARVQRAGWGLLLVLGMPRLLVLVLRAEWGRRLVWAQLLASHLVALLGQLLGWVRPQRWVPVRRQVSALLLVPAP